MIEPTPTNRQTTEKAIAAFAVVAEKVIQRARQTGTKVIVWEDGQVKELEPEVFLVTRPDAPQVQEAAD